MNDKGISPLRLRNSNSDAHPSKMKLRESPISFREDKENMYSQKRNKTTLKPHKTPQMTNPTCSWMESETKHCNPAKLSRTCSQISDSMRSKLIKWLIEVCDILSLDREVFFLSVDILDRFLSQENASSIRSEELQLVGIAALFVSSKFESVEFCAAEEYAEMTANAFSPHDLVTMEIRILRALKWNISIPTSIHWLKLLLQSYFTNDPDIPDFSQYKLVQGSKMLIHVLLDGDSFKFRRSMLSCGVFSLLMRKINPQYELDEQFSVYKQSELVKCMSHVMKVVKPELSSLSAMGHEVFSNKDARDKHNIVHWDVCFASKSKRQCPVE